MSPIDKSWGEEEKVEYIAQITELREAEELSEIDGTPQMVRRIYVDLRDLDPDVVTRFPIRFKASRHRNADWIKWLNGIEYLGFKCKDDPNVLEGTFIHVKEEPIGFQNPAGEWVNYFFPRVHGHFTSEDTAQEVFEGLPKRPPTTASVLSMEDELKAKQLWDAVDGKEGPFKNAYEPPQGVSVDAVIAMLKAEVPF